MKTTILLITVAVFIFVCLLARKYMKQFCKDCHSKMDRYYDPLIGSYAYQCTKCGKIYMI